MDEAIFGGLLLVLAAATIAPLIVDIIPRVRFPVVIVEILLGIILGPHILDFIHHSTGLEIAKEFGVIFLFFLAGFEIDFEGISGAPLRTAGTTWVGSVVLAIGFAFLLYQLDLSSTMLIAFAIATTALGPLMPIMQDSGLIHTRFGSHVLAIGAVGEFGPVLAIAFLLNETRASFVTALAVMLFLAVVGLLLMAGKRIGNSEHDSRIRRIAIQTLDSSAQFAVRVSVLLLVGLVYLAARFDLDILLGAFASGFIIGQLGDVTSSGQSRHVMEWMKTKFEAIGFGVFIPIFFVMTGVDFRIDLLLDSTRALIILPLGVVASFIIRGVPVLIGYRRFERGMRLRLALVAATQLPLVATLMDEFIADGDIPADVGTAIVGSAIITVAVFPLMALNGLSAPSGDTDDTDDHVVEALPEIPKPA